MMVIANIEDIFHLDEGNKDYPELYGDCDLDGMEENKGIDK